MTPALLALLHKLTEAGVVALAPLYAADAKELDRLMRAVEAEAAARATEAPVFQPGLAVGRARS